MNISALWPGWLGGQRYQRALRMVLSSYVLNGALCAIGMLLISAFVRGVFGADAGATATVGVMATLAPDLVGPRRGKLAYMIASPLIGVPLFLAVQLLHKQPVELGVFLVAATFLSFLGMAWGKRGAPVAIGVMLGVIFALSTAPPQDTHAALARALYCGLGSLLYVFYSVLVNLLANGRYRTQRTAETLLALAALMLTHARRIAPDEAAQPETGPAATQGVSELLNQHATLATLLQAARDVILESPRTPRRQRLAAMLLVALEMRDYLVAGELDLDRVRPHPGNEAVLRGLASVYRGMAGDLARMADALLLGREPAPPADRGEPLAKLAKLAAANLPPPAMDSADSANANASDHAARLLRGVALRITHQNSAILQLGALARGQALPDLNMVRNNWRLFVSPTAWSLQPFFGLWHWQQPALRHAVRAALAMGTGYAIATLLPWGSHAYWVLLTIAVVLRGSLAQTLERRNQRVAGALVGSLLATGLLALHPPAWGLLLAVTAAQGVAHAFAPRRYLVAAIAASVMGLVQAHILNTSGSPAFALIERVGDTLLGAVIAWGFSYVLPSWERGQLAKLVRRTLQALSLHARRSLGLATLNEIDTQTDLAWRLARREAYDALSELVLATQRSLSEPHAVRPPVPLLELLQGHSYQLLAQLSAVKSLLLLRPEQLQAERIAAPLQQSAARIEAALAPDAPPAAPAPAPPETTPDAPGAEEEDPPATLPGPFQQDTSPWLLRRLHLAEGLADQVRENARAVLTAIETSTATPD
ncbi:MAG: FUSC family protein [Burkholderiaceae bacterium]|jgi:uncharacterized membrane protein YccC|nr:FUSC family protein [Burkholderiaceae bacterium]